MSDNGSKSSVELREAIKNKPYIAARDLPALMEEMEAIYNFMSEHGKTPSEAFERLILVMQQEHAIYDHPDRDVFWVCPTCKRA